MKILLLIIVLSGCSVVSSSSSRLGHWVDTYPSEYSIWQCVESITPYKNKEC
jgi:uncharacterized protein YceK